MDCIFCKIANKEIPSDIVYESDTALAFKDIKPSAPVHYLIIPRRHIQSVTHLEEKDRDIVAALVFIAKDLANKSGLKGYKTVFNVGREGGQIIDHLHLHLLGGWKNGEGNRLPHPSLDR